MLEQSLQTVQIPLVYLRRKCDPMPTEMSGFPQMQIGEDQGLPGRPIQAPLRANQPMLFREIYFFFFHWVSFSIRPLRSSLDKDCLRLSTFIGKLKGVK